MTKDRGWKYRRVRLGRAFWTYLGGVSLATSGVLGALALRPWWADIVAGIGRWWPTVGAVSLLGVGVAAMHRRTMIAADDASQARILEAVPVGTTASSTMEAAERRSSLSGWVVLAAAVGVLGIAALVLAALWDWAAAPGLGVKDAASTRIETAKIAASVAVAGGGLFALYLAARRQRTQELELAQRRDEFAHSEHDATERRVTELYTKAVEQLGSEKAVVRQGGLYALERVAHDNPAHRQTVINVICAYLRAPYSPPPERPAARRTGLTATSLSGAPAARVAGFTVATRRTTLNPPTLAPTRDDLRQEREVRLTAQRILSTHLRPGIDPDTGGPTNPRYWSEGYDVDLTGATLIDLDMTGCQMDAASFRVAMFSGDANFKGATFTSYPNFNGATFTGYADFDHATFTRDADFHHATFTGDADFDGATFARDANFDHATFTRDANFYRTMFTGDADFDGATFARDANFDHTTFTRDANFDGTMFTCYADFDHATFTGNADFDHATFTGYADFDHTTFPRGADFDHTTFTGYAQFDHATFTGNADFDHATFTGYGDFDHATFTGNANFDHATFTRGADFHHTTFTRNANFDHAVFVSMAMAHDAWARVDQVTRDEAWPAGWTVDASTSVPRDGRDGRWAKLIPVPIVLAPLPPELASSE